MEITNEMLAAYLEGKADEELTLQVLYAIKTDAEFRERVEMAMSVDAEIGEMPEFDLSQPSEAPRVIDIIPMMQLAAKDDENICSVICEAYIMQRRQVQFDMNELLVTARERHWLKTEGTPLHAIGQLLAQNGLLVTRKYDATLDDLVKVLDLDNDIIVAVDIQKLYEEHPEVDSVINHAVVVTSVDVDAGVVSIFDPQKRAAVDIQLSYFENAWRDSHHYMVRVLQSIREYDPEPVRLDGVDLSDDLIELREAIAENLHDVWAITRISEGWTYGPARDDEKKQHPDIIPYCALPDGEKEYDRLMAWNTLKLVKKLGFEIKMPRTDIRKN